MRPHCNTAQLPKTAGGKLKKSEKKKKQKEKMLQYENRAPDKARTNWTTIHAGSELAMITPAVVKRAYRVGSTA
jgi:hypothetical protein